MDYLVWADQSMVKMIGNITHEELIKEVSQGASIQSKLIHLVEEYMGWLFDLKKMDLRQELVKIHGLSFDGLIRELLSYHNKWQKFFDSHDKMNFEFFENGIKVELSWFQVIFNIVNHSSYHRGQIISILRIHGHEVEITDYYWFIRSKNK